MAERIGKYEIVAEIGRGGFGCVYRAIDTTLGRPVAVKVLNSTGDKALLARFRKEAAAAGRLQHENIVTVYEFGEQKGVPFIAMELLAGEDLQSIVQTRKPLTVLEKVRIMAQVAAGLHCAHRNGVVHRDVKPANIMVRPDGTVKIMDFGIARVAGEGGTRLTQHGFLVGSIMYMAPEQFGEVDADPESDIFAYGIVFYEFLTGRHPFQAADVPSTIRLITAGDPPPVRSAVPECPAGLEAVVLRALERDRESRYRTMEDLLFDLRPVQAELQMRRAVELAGTARDLHAAGNLTAARDAVRQALELDPNNTAALRLRELMRQQLGHGKPGTAGIDARSSQQDAAGEAARRSRELCERKLYAQASEEVEAALREFGSDPRLLEVREAIHDAWLENGGAQARQTADGAAEECDRLRREGKLVAATEKLFAFYRQTGQDPALAAVEQRLEDDWREVRGALRAASDCEQAGRFEPALEIVERARARYPGVPELGIAAHRLKGRLKDNRVEAARAAAVPAAPFVSATRILDPRAPLALPWASASAAPGAAPEAERPAPAFAPARRTVWPLVFAFLGSAMAAGAGLVYFHHPRPAPQPQASTANTTAQAALAAHVPISDSAGPGKPGQAAPDRNQGPSHTQAQAAPAARVPLSENAAPEKPEQAASDQDVPAAAGRTGKTSVSQQKGAARGQNDDDTAEADSAPALPQPGPAEPGTPPYYGPPSVELTWAGSLAPSAQVTLRGASASQGRITNGGILPRHQGTISVSPPGTVVVQPPSAENDFRVVLQNNSESPIEAVKVVWRLAR